MNDRFENHCKKTDFIIRIMISVQLLAIALLITSIKRDVQKILRFEKAMYNTDNCCYTDDNSKNSINIVIRRIDAFNCQ